MTDYPTNQGNPSGAIPVYLAAGGAAGAVKSLNAVLVTGAGTVLPFVSGQARTGMQVSYTSNPTAVAVDIEGTIDGTNWVVLASYNGGSGGTDANGAIVVTANLPVLKVRANLKTLTGGTAPAVTATLLAA